ncbi:kinase-like protein [Microthyrium microscopicum]|uniref:non-specific serine/threonine protein kinase n=1 Tax=Microthyrium microscopicum TaxID=703497 RepID=A0A6A6UQB4_9PEZI|nr:kinase-like protein [Microthyrium microscopicum]
MADEATQPATQQMLDPRRLGRNNSGLSEEDVSDVLCILHPGSPAAFDICRRTAQENPQHVLQGHDTFEEGLEDTFDLDLDNVKGLALRFSSRLKLPPMGFTFGRHPDKCDIVLNDGDEKSRRISNVHFRIYINEHGVLLLEDESTNGTVVDDVHLKRRENNGKPTTRTLSNMTRIVIPCVSQKHNIFFHVHIPPRDGHEAKYRQKFENYMAMLAKYPKGATDLTRRRPVMNTGNSSRAPYIQTNRFGMVWDGSPDYRVSGFLGKGAFANVYHLTTCMDGRVLAVKELEKRRFIKDGVLDRRLSNEIQIMRAIKHPHIVQYEDFRDVNDHLYIMMEYVPCGDLQKYLKQGLLTEDNGMLLARQVLQALAYLHESKITHRDIKPDNILIASEDPLFVKLSDFGLSKATTNDTFTKTFCGTLLYCAPEVFPHYHNEKQGTKRRHGRKSHSYDYAVDIWSLGGVLWFGLSGLPPFEGVVDQNGRGMYDKITKTNLDTSPLDNVGLSANVKDLLNQMLTVQPDNRPSAVECLNHPWLFTGEIITEPNRGLKPIAEEVEEQKFSQLSIDDLPAAAGAEHDFDNMFDEHDLDDLVFADELNRSKRVKKDERFPRMQTRDISDKESSDDQWVPDPSAPEGQLILPFVSPGPRRLFGEIGASALANSKVLGQQTKQALEVYSPSLSQPQHDPSQPAASLLGAESLLNAIKMVESDSHSSGLESSANSIASATAGAEFQNHQTDFSDSQATPRANQNISKFDSQADSTPTRRPAMPDTIYQPDPPTMASATNPFQQHSLTAEVAQSFSENRPRIGTLITTNDSVEQIFLPLNKRYENWGRAPQNTNVYPNKLDTRIPKRAFAILFQSRNLDEVIKNDGDWSTLTDLFVQISAFSKQGIWINGTRLPEKNAEGRGLFGVVYTGDVITVVPPNGNGDGPIRFVCTFNHGLAKEPRKDPFEIQLMPPRL